MKIVQVHNYYRHFGGECRVFEKTVSLLKEAGNEVYLYNRHSGNIANSLWKKISSSLHSGYSLPTLLDFSKFLRAVRPDIVHAHNLFPLITPSVFTACKKLDIPVVMTCHNYRLACPVTTCFAEGQICHACSNGKEYNCIIRNCRHNRLESVIYAMRNAVARTTRAYHRNVDCFIVVSNVVKEFLLENSIDESKIAVVPNSVSRPTDQPDCSHGQYVGFAGRISEEKGISQLIEMAKRLPHIPIYVAGGISSAGLQNLQAPDNINFCGFLSPEKMDQFYQNAKMVIVPSLWQEPFGLVAIEAMKNGIPVIAFRAGALGEIVDDGVNGRICEINDTECLAATVEELWDAPQACKQLGEQGRQKVIDHYGDSVYLDRITDVYKKLIASSKK